MAGFTAQHPGAFGSKHESDLKKSCRRNPPLGLLGWKASVPTRKMHTGGVRHGGGTRGKGPNVYTDFLLWIHGCHTVCNAMTAVDPQGQCVMRSHTELNSFV